MTDPRDPADLGCLLGALVGPALIAAALIGVAVLVLWLVG